MALRSIRAFNRTWDLVVERDNARIRVSVEQAGKRLFNHATEQGGEVGGEVGVVQP